MSFGSFMGRLAAFAGLSSSAPAADVTMNEPLLGTATSSLGNGHLFGNWLFGFGSHHSQTGTWGIEDMLELRRALFWIAAVVIILLIAAVTNPTEASFRSHLTELSFRRHLADIRSSDSSIPSHTEEDGSTITLPSSGPPAGEPSGTGTETPPIAPFRFANHVAISLRTPPLLYKTLFFLSIALTSPLAPPIYLSDPTPIGKKHATPVPRERKVLYIGYLGHWVLVGQVPTKVEWVWRLFTDGSKEKGKKRNALLDRAGITELRSIASKEESSLVTKAITGLSTLTPGKGNRKLEVIPADNGTLPLHAHPGTIPVAPFIPESRRTSIVNLVASQPLNTASLDSSDAASSPLITSLKADLAAAQSALAEVQAQLHAHDVSVSSAHLHLQTSLDEVRTRRKEDDAERQELKSRTKSLEDQKRQAESAKRDAEKKLKSIETIRDGLEAKIQAALGEIQDLKGLMEISGKNLRTIQEHGARFVIETRDAIEGKKEELEEVEGDIGELDARNEELGRAIKEAEEKVELAIKAGEDARKIGPEEEMMMMAAAYEAAAQEGYNHHPPAHNHNNDRRNGAAAGGAAGNGDQWAHQAAQYMAEAGMPYIDHQNYTARPSHSTSFGQFAKPHKAVEEKRPADLIGFEDFGPGAKNKRTTTPPASDSGSDVWGHDPGSPNGGISSSFSANLLPQGLFRSLEGDQTPLDAATDADDESVSVFPTQDLDVLEGEEHDYGSGSESSDEHSGHEADIEPENAWKSPLPAPGALQPGQQASADRPFLPPTSTPPLAIPNQGAAQQSSSALPGLPAPLPGVRRWYSGTNSSENVNNIFGVSPSNDSLLLSGYEASPFAPTSSEKQQLALKWGSLSKRWGSGRNDSPAAVNAGPLHPGTTRSISADLSGGGGWLSHRLQKGDDKADLNLSPPEAGQPQGQGQGGPAGEKKPFRFFSLRRPTSSGSGNDRSGTSPARE